jgi:hypothetical protein
MLEEGQSLDSGKKLLLSPQRLQLAKSNTCTPDK